MHIGDHVLDVFWKLIEMMPPVVFSLDCALSKYDAYFLMSRQLLL